MAIFGFDEVQLCLLVTGAFMGLVALPGVVKPAWHMKKLLPFKLPDPNKDVKTTSQLVLNHYMMSTTRLQTAGLVIAMAYACPGITTIVYLIMFYVATLTLAYPYVFGSSKMDSKKTLVGMDDKAATMLVIVGGVFMAYLAVTLVMNLGSGFATLSMPSEPMAVTIVAVSTLFTVSNIPPIFNPAMALEQYMEKGAMSKDKYAIAKYGMYMRFNGNGWVFLNGGTLLAVLQTTDETFPIIGALFVVYNLYYSIFFITVMTNPQYGFQKLPLLVYLFICAFTAGGVAMGLISD